MYAALKVPFLVGFQSTIRCAVGSCPMRSFSFGISRSHGMASIRSYYKLGLPGRLGFTIMKHPPMLRIGAGWQKIIAVESMSIITQEDKRW